MKITLSLLLLLPTVFIAFSQDSTVISATPNAQIDGKSNVLYCSSAEILWSKLVAKLGEAPVPTELNLEINDLNQYTQNYQAPLDSQFWLAEVGTLNDGVLDRIQLAYKQQFDQQWVKPNLEQNQLFGHCFLKKNLAFYSILHDDFDEPFGGKIVEYFGLKFPWANPKYNEKLRIHDFVDLNNFIFEIGCKDDNDQIYFAKVPSQGNLENTFSHVMERVGKGDTTRLGEFDQLKIPYLKFDIEKNYETIESAEFANNLLREATFSEFSQQIAFDLNGEGVKLESSTTSIIELAAIDFEPKTYIFDRPFLIIIKRRNSERPYFLYWVQNTQHMRTWDK